MINELELLTLLSKKDIYERLFKYVKDYIITKETNKLLKAYGEYFSTYSTEVQIDFSKFHQFFFVAKSYVSSAKEVEVYQKIIGLLSSKAVDESLVDDLKNALISKDYFTRIADTAIKAGTSATGEVNINDIEDLVLEYQMEVVRSSAKAEDIYELPDISAMVGTVFSHGYEWRLEELNLAAGPVRAGDFIILSAPPETGKTTFLAAEMSYMGSQMKVEDECILWFNNEEQSSKVMFRIVQAATGWDKGRILLDTKAAMEEYERVVGTKHRIRIPKDSFGVTSTKDIERIVKDVKPKIVVFDQLDKFYGFSKSETETLRLGALYKWARELAKRCECVVIAASQADGTAIGNKYLSAHQLRWSKVDKQGEADLIITIGREDDTTPIRGICLPKNKLVGGPRSEEAYRHGQFDVTIKPEIARYEGVFPNPGF